MRKLIHFDIYSFNTEKLKAFNWTSISYAGAEDFCQISNTDRELLGAVSGNLTC
jgi:hypothetical protein